MTNEARVETLSKLLGKTTARLRKTDQATAEALLKAGQELVAQIRAGQL